MNRSRIPVLAALALMLTLTLPVSAASGRTKGGAAHLFGPDDRPFGQTYSKIFADASEWAFEIPAGRNPLLHPRSPRNCEVHGSFVYTGAGTGRTCTVPRGTAAVLSTGGYECSTAEGNGKTFAALRSCARKHFEHDFAPARFTLRMWVDGKQVSQPRRWVSGTDDRVLDLPVRNMWGAKPGPTRSSTYGFVYVVKLGCAGTHVVRVVAKDVKFGPATFVYRFKVT